MPSKLSTNISKPIRPAPKQNTLSFPTIRPPSSSELLRRYRAVREKQILSGMATGFALHKQLESYEDVVASNFLPRVDAVSECLTKRSKITVLQ